MKTFCYFLGMILGIISLFKAQDNRIERRFACWGSAGPPVVSAQCPRNTVLDIVRAGLKVQNAGSKCEFEESDCGCTSEESGCQMPDVRDLCMGKSSCRLDVTQQYIGTGRCHGFSDYMYIEYKCVKATQKASHDVCNAGNLQHSSGFLHSPNHPDPYPDNRHCECTLIAENDATIDIQILDLQLRDRDCNNDYLTLEYDGQETMFCGQSNGLRETISTSSNNVLLAFHTDGSYAENGFWIKYEAQPRSQIQISCVSKVKESVDSTNDGVLTPSGTEIPEVLWIVPTAAVPMLQPDSEKSETNEVKIISDETIAKDGAVFETEDYTLNYEEDQDTKKDTNTDSKAEGLLVSTEDNIIEESDNQAIPSYDLNFDISDDNEIDQKTETIIISDESDFGLSETILQNEIELETPNYFENTIEEEIIADEIIPQQEKVLYPPLAETPDRSRQNSLFEGDVRSVVSSSNDLEFGPENIEEFKNNAPDGGEPEFHVIPRLVPNGRRRISRLNLLRFRERMRNQNNAGRAGHNVNTEKIVSEGNAEIVENDDAIDRIEAARQDFERFSYIATDGRKELEPGETNIRQRSNQRPADDRRLIEEDYQYINFQRHQPNVAMSNNHNNDNNNDINRQYTEESVGKTPPTKQSTTPWWWKYTAKGQSVQPTKSPINTKPKLSQDLKDNKLSNIPKDFGENGVSARGSGVDSQGNIAGDTLQNIEDKDTKGDGKIYAEKQQQSATVTVVAVGVIGLIVLIIMLGIAVRWFLNKREAKRAWRQRHRKECALRQQAARQSSRHR